VARKAEVTLEFQQYINQPPASPTDLYKQACSNDDVTIDTWLKTWVGNIKTNREKFGSFKDRGVGKLFGSNELKPAIVAGSGPSLAYNSDQLKDRNGIPLISCLHNFHHFVDKDIPVDYWVSLDAGDVTLEEIWEGGKNTPDFYREKTKDQKLVCFIGSSPKLLDYWGGEVYFFNAPVPSDEYRKQCDEIEPFYTYLSTGGNVLGAAVYFAKGVLGANPIAFVGADFCFSYEKKFHGWDSKYDKNVGKVLKVFDIFGMPVFSWQSYLNFKCFFEYVAMKVPGLYVNCSEGGTLGAHLEGNIRHITQMELQEFLNMYRMHRLIEGQCKQPEILEQKILY